MSGIIRRVNSILTKFIGQFCGFESGGFKLCRGNHKFEVCLDFNPEKVWVNTDECVADGCGNIPVNMVGCTYLPGRIIFEARIETDIAHITWFATS